VDPLHGKAPSPRVELLLHGGTLWQTSVLSQLVIVKDLLAMRQTTSALLPDAEYNRSFGDGSVVFSPFQIHLWALPADVRPPADVARRWGLSNSKTIQNLGTGFLNGPTPTFLGNSGVLPISQKIQLHSNPSNLQAICL